MLLVIIMENKYYIFYVKNKYLLLCDTYPDFIRYIFCDAINSFNTKQNEEIFESMNLKKYYFIDYLDKRMDYIHENRTYYIKNIITDENIEVKMHEYCIEVIESEGKSVVYDILREYSKNFYMIMS